MVGLEPTLPKELGFESSAASLLRHIGKTWWAWRDSNSQ